MAQIITVDLGAYDPALPGVRTLRFATQGYTTKPGDTPANTHYEGRIQQPAAFLRSVFADGRTYGRSQMGYGDLVLANNDGGLDYLLDYAFSGRSITIKVGEVTASSGGTPVWTTVLAGVVEQATFTWEAVRIRVRDRQLELTKPVQALRYGSGTPTGLDGTTEDLDDRPKPLIYGTVLNVPPPMVNSDLLVFQVHSGSQLYAVDAVYDAGVRLSRGDDYVSQADMEANAPTARQYRVWNDATHGCYVRLGAMPNGLVTADARAGLTDESRRTGAIIQQILTLAGVTNVSASDLTSLDAAAPYTVGLWIGPDRDMTVAEAMDALVNSVGAWYGVDSSGLFRVQRITPPTGEGVGTITALETVRVQRVTTRDTGGSVPSWRVRLKYRPVWAQQIDLGPNVAASRRQFLAMGHRRVQASDPAVKTAHLISPEMEFMTLLYERADAQAEAARRLTLYGVRRDMLELRVRVDAALAALLDIGKVITVQLPRYGLSAGRPFLIVGLRTDMRTYTFDLTVWG